MGRRRYWRTTKSLVLVGALFMIGTAMAANIPDVDRAAYTIEGSPTKTIHYYYNQNDEIILSAENLFTYDGNGNVLEELYRPAYDGVLENGTRTTYEYTAGGLESTETEAYWTGSSWEPSSRYIYTYADGIPTQIVMETTDGTTWTASYRNIYTVIDESTLKVDLSYHDGTEWVIYSTQTMTINSNGDPTVVLVSSNDGGALVENSRETYEYNPDGSLSVETYYDRETESDPWAVHMTTSYTYDEQGRLTLSLMSIRDWVTENMREHERVNYTYDGEGRLTEEMLYMRDTADSPWKPSDKTVYVYDNNTAVESDAVPATFALMQNSPNPFNPSTVIPFSLNEAGSVKLEVYSSTGQKVATLVDGTMDAGVHRINWNAAGLASGVYISRLTVEGVARTGKMLFVK